MDKEQLFKERAARVETAASLGTPDRVPFVPMVSGFYMLGYGVSFYDAMKDPRTMTKGVRQFLLDYAPDAAKLPGLYGMDALEALGTKYLRWPGPDHDVDLDVSYQHLDMESLMEDEYEEFIADPTHTILTKLLPRKHEKLKGLAKLDFHDVYDKSLVEGLSIFCDPEVKTALQAMEDAGRATIRFKQRTSEVMQVLKEEGVPTIYDGGLTIPFDAFTDSVRGLINTMMDLLTCPEDVNRAVAALTNLVLEKKIKAAAARGVKRIMMPLHSGVDEFMSPTNYEQYYWPNLKRCIETIIKYGMTPICYCEGNYNTRLEVLCDVPVGKVIYMFEKVDIQRVKDTVGKVACVCGNLDNTLLAYGKPEEVEKETRRQIDILAPGGGFMMDCSAMLDNADHKNMHVWRETTEKYGVYT